MVSAARLGESGGQRSDDCDVEGGLGVFFGCARGFSSRNEVLDSRMEFDGFRLVRVAASLSDLRLRLRYLIGAPLQRYSGPATPQLPRGVRQDKPQYHNVARLARVDSRSPVKQPHAAEVDGYFHRILFIVAMTTAGCTPNQNTAIQSLARICLTVGQELHTGSKTAR